MDEPLIPSRRRTPRGLVRHTATCAIGRETWLGTVYDLSEHGAFFEPTRCTTSGEVLDPEDAWMVASTKTLVDLRITDAEGGRWRGLVCWSGHSDMHGRAGLGVCFEAVAQRDAA